MSQENADALKQALAEAVTQFEDFLAILDEDVVWDPGNQFPGGRVHGHDGVREFFRQWFGAFENFGSETKEWIDAGNSVYTHVRQWGRGKGSGAAAENDFWLVWLFFQGKVVRVTYFPTRGEALEAAGLQE
jgi:ketosteroid isomerase-like protein